MGSGDRERQRQRDRETERLWHQTEAIDRGLKGRHDLSGSPVHGSSNGTPARRADGLSLKRRVSKEWRTIIDGEKMQHHTRKEGEG